MPARGAAVMSADRAVGEVTQRRPVARARQPIALAYVQRDFIAPGTVLSVDGARRNRDGAAVCSAGVVQAFRPAVRRT